MHLLIVISIQGRSRILEFALDMPQSDNADRKEEGLVAEGSSPLLDLLVAFSMFLPMEAVPGGTVASRFLEAAMSTHQIAPSTPASRLAVNALPAKVLNSVEAGTLCTICQDSLQDAENHEHRKVIELPCKHLYHEECLFSWLSVRNTCPVCRFSLPLATSEADRIEARATATVTEDDLSLDSKLVVSTDEPVIESSPAAIAPPSPDPPVVRTHLLHSSRRPSRFRSSRSSLMPRPSSSSTVAASSVRGGWWKRYFRPSCLGGSRRLN
eukprot:gb/GEZN01009023.1/.p1 GENE.gb/GEZN01009023.1/~~gb/GEZN01009023.1/.p1  ORF type:complete len:268 (-),score=30.33 gb/GEZN01009023.1/:362-1165(-)